MNKIDKNIYCEQYYTSGNYSNYLNKSERYHKLASEINYFLSSIGFKSKEYKILDFGCAVGFLLDGLKNNGYNNIFGFDISDWAIDIVAKKHNTLAYETCKNEKFDITFALDVFEHMTDEEIEEFLNKIDTKILIFRIPVSNNGGKSYVLDISNNDTTHINCKEKNDWVSIFRAKNFVFYLPLNLNSIYDTEGVFCGIAFKM